MGSTIQTQAFMWFTAASLAAGTAFAQSGPATKIAVVPTNFDVSAKGVPADIFDDTVLTAVQEATGQQVIGQDDLNALIGFEKTKGLVGCDDTSCFAELGGAIGADRLVVIRVARVTGEWMITAKLIDIKKTRVVARVSDFVPGNLKNLIVQMPAVVAKLFGQAPPAALAVEPWTAYGLSETQWRDYTAYRDLAQKVGYRAATPEQWQTDVVPVGEAWSAYLRAYGKTGPNERVDFDTWYESRWLGQLTVESTPNRARVFIDGEAAGLCPVTRQLRGTHTLKVTLDGYLAQERRVSVDGGQKTTVKIELVSETAVLSRAKEAAADRSFGFIAGSVSLGTAAALVAGGVVMVVMAGTEGGIREQHYQPMLEAATAAEADERYADLERAVQQHNTLLPIGWSLVGVGALATGLGVYFFATVPAKVDTTLVAAPNGAGVSLLWSTRF